MVHRDLSKSSIGRGPTLQFRRAAHLWTIEFCALQIGEHSDGFTLFVAAQGFEYPLSQGTLVHDVVEAQRMVDFFALRQGLRRWLPRFEHRSVTS